MPISSFLILMLIRLDIVVSCSNSMTFRQDSFEIPRPQSSRTRDDIELGSLQMNSAELGLDNFFKKVVIESPK